MSVSLSEAVFLISELHRYIHTYMCLLSQRRVPEIVRRIDPYE